MVEPRGPAHVAVSAVVSVAWAVALGASVMGTVRALRKGEKEELGYAAAPTVLLALSSMFWLCNEIWWTVGRAGGLVEVPSEVTGLVEALLTVCGSVFMVLAQLNMAFFWLEVLGASMSKRVYRVERYSLWLRIIGGVYATIFLLAVGVYFASPRASFSIGAVLILGGGLGAAVAVGYSGSRILTKFHSLSSGIEITSRRRVIRTISALVWSTCIGTAAFILLTIIDLIASLQGIGAAIGRLAYAVIVVSMIHTLWIDPTHTESASSNPPAKVKAGGDQTGEATPGRLSDPPQEAAGTGTGTPTGAAAPARGGAGSSARRTTDSDSSSRKKADAVGAGAAQASPGVWVPRVGVRKTIQDMRSADAAVPHIGTP